MPGILGSSSLSPALHTGPLDVSSCSGPSSAKCLPDGNSAGSSGAASPPDRVPPSLVTELLLSTVGHL